jgi:hypothetical protein
VHRFPSVAIYVPFFHCPPRSRRPSPRAGLPQTRIKHTPRPPGSCPAGLLELTARLKLMAPRRFGTKKPRTMPGL